MNIIDQHFERFKNEVSSLNEHMETFKLYTQECEHVTELGTCEVVSTWGFLAGRPKKFVTVDLVDRYVDIQATGRLQLAEQAAADNNIEFQFRMADTSDPSFVIEETDLLFIDTWHVYDQLKKELALHSSKAKKYILLHDTSTFGELGEIAAYNCNIKPNDVCDLSPRKGLWQAVEEFLENNNEWILKERFMHNNGLTILVRK